MTNEEKIARLTEKLGISAEEAERHLEDNGWDVLDAAIAAERSGAAAGGTATYETGNAATGNNYVPSPEMEDAQREWRQRSGDDGRASETAWDSLVAALRRFAAIRVVVRHGDGRSFAPLPVILVLLVLFPWLTLATMLALMILGARFAIETPSGEFGDFGFTTGLGSDGGAGSQKRAADDGSDGSETAA